jgi:hypothetical protein
LRSIKRRRRKLLLDGAVETVHVNGASYVLLNMLLEMHFDIHPMDALPKEGDSALPLQRPKHKRVQYRGYSHLHSLFFAPFCFTLYQVVPPPRS